MSKVIPYHSIDASWTLFLDRDGVINYEKNLDYIHTWDEFKFYEGAVKAISIFAGIFNKIVVVTNQKGVGKGLTKEADLLLIHENMVKEILAAGGRLDAIYFATDLDDNSINRKPNKGMGLQAIATFPEIDLNKTIMVGNTLSDMKFARNLGVYSIFLPTTRPEVDLKSDLIDDVQPSLLAVAEIMLAAAANL